MSLSHLDGRGRARMVDVSDRGETRREATARGLVACLRETLALIRDGAGKGDVLAVAQVAGIMAAKRTPELVPLCHPLPLSHVDVRLDLDEELSHVAIEATVRTTAATGVEMEALTAVSVAALTVIDMIKSSDPWATLREVGLVSKRGGRGGERTRPAEPRRDPGTSLPDRGDCQP